MVRDVLRIARQRCPRLVVTTHIFWVCVALAFPPPTAATAVIALLDVHNHRIVLAADSRVEHSVTPSSLRCKLIEMPECAFGMVGFFDKPHPAFHLEEIARTACKTPGGLQQKADSFIAIAKERVIALVEYLKDNEPTYYAEQVAVETKDFVTVIFVGTESGYLSVIAPGFRVSKYGRVSSFENSLVDNGKVAESNLFAAGFNDHVLEYARAHPEWTSMDSVAAAKKFIGLEIRAHPKSVGRPISILQVDWLDRYAWIDRGVCQDQNTKHPKNK